MYFWKILLYQAKQPWRQVKEQYLALQELKEVQVRGASKKSIAEKFGIPQNTLMYWIANKKQIISNYVPGQLGAKHQKLSTGKFDGVDKAVNKWFMNACE